MQRFGAQQRYFFHASPPEHRDSIKKHGLRPGESASYGQPGVYLFRHQLIAENYISEEAMDVWRVDATGFVVEIDPEDRKEAAYVEKPIPASRLKYLGTFKDGEPVKEPSKLVAMVAARFAAQTAYFKVGDPILFGKYKNKRGIIIRVFEDEKGHPSIEVEPVPKGRKKNRIMGLYKIWHDPDPPEPEEDDGK